MHCDTLCGQDPLSNIKQFRIPEHWLTLARPWGVDANTADTAANTADLYCLLFNNLIRYEHEANF